MTILKHNWNEVRDRYRAFWRGEKLDRPPVIFDTVGAWRHPMYRGAGYDYTKYGEDIAAVHWHTVGMHLIPALLEIPNLRMIQLSPDPNGPDFETVLAACRPIVEAGRKVCFQIGFDEHCLRRIFATLPPDACLFYFGYAADARAGEEILRAVSRLAKNGRGSSCWIRGMRGADRTGG